MKPPKTSRWRCSECRNWYPFPYPTLPAVAAPWRCHYCLRADVDRIARRILEGAGLVEAQ